MRTAFLGLAAAAAMFGAPAAVSAQESCGTYRATCESVCTPQRAARYYAGSIARCASSCEPRWQQCLRTGTWADIEFRYGGYWERATRF